ncbi:MAG: glycosyltransferase [Opitutae bacterium]
MEPNQLDQLKSRISELEQLGRHEEAYKLIVKKRRRNIADPQLNLIFAELCSRLNKHNQAIEAYAALYDRVNEKGVLIAKLLSSVGESPNAKVPKKLRADITQLLARHLKAASRSDRLRLVVTIFDLLRINRESATRRSDELFESYVLPVADSLLSLQAFDELLWLESQCHEILVKQDESEKRFQYVSHLLAQRTERAGLIKRETLPSLRLSEPNSKIAFFIHAASTLAHVEGFLNTISALKTHAKIKIEPVLVIFSGKDENLNSRCRDLGIQIKSLDEKGTRNSATAKLIETRNFLREEGINVLVWLCLAAFMPFAMTIRMAPIQVWWSMKFHSYFSPSIDIYLASYFQASIPAIGNHWLESFLPYEVPPKPTELAIQQARASLGNNVRVIAALAREEKIASTVFLNKVRTILEATDNTIFVWTGRQENRDVKLFFEKHQLANRVAFVGWVDTNLYANVIDILIDTFPSSSGFTLLNAMAAGKPVLFSSPEFSSHRGHISATLKKIPATLSRDELSLWEYTLSRSEDYLAFLEELQDPALVSSIGNLNKKIIEKVMANSHASAQLYETHFNKIMASARTSSGTTVTT